ncbi:MAG: hypothetical protein V5A17_12140, partial [Natronomonas sp.]
MKRTNTFAVRPLTDTGEQLLRDLLDASAALWNEVTYERLMRYNNEDGFEGEDVWDADTGRPRRPPRRLYRSQTRAPETPADCGS